MALTTQVRKTFAGTPGKMRGYGLIAVFGCLLFGVLSGVAAASSQGAVHRAGDDVAQLVRVQRIATDLLAADASASTSYLAAGQSADRNFDFERALRNADRLIAEAAAAQPADAEALAELNVAITRYASLIERARTDNRHGLVVGQQYQRLASQSLRAECLPIVDALVVANRTRLGGQGAVADGGEIGWPTRQALMQVAAILAALAVLLAVSRWLARTTHRRFNVLLLAAAIVVVAGGLIGLTAQVVTIGRLADFRAGPMKEARDAAQTRRALYDARAIEGLQLIGQGHGDYEASFQAAVQQIDVPLGQSALAEYRAQHAQARRLDDDEGRWADAVALTSDPSRSGFAQLDGAITAQSQRVEQALGQALVGDRLLALLKWVLPGFGLVAGLLAVQGMEQRIAEYR